MNEWDVNLIEATITSIECGYSNALQLRFGFLFIPISFFVVIEDLNTSKPADKVWTCVRSTLSGEESAHVEKNRMSEYETHESNVWEGLDIDGKRGIILSENP